MHRMTEESRWIAITTGGQALIDAIYRTQEQPLAVPLLDGGPGGLDVRACQVLGIVPTLSEQLLNAPPPTGDIVVDATVQQGARRALIAAVAAGLHGNQTLALRGVDVALSGMYFARGGSSAGREGRKNDFRTVPNGTGRSNRPFPGFEPSESRAGTFEPSIPS